MGESTTLQLQNVEKIHSATTIRYVRGWDLQLTFDTGWDYLLGAENALEILTVSKFAEACKVFIDKLENPVEFINNSTIHAQFKKLPTELRLRAAMEVFANEKTDRE